MDGTTVVCADCAHRRETTERYPTLAACLACGSPNVSYAEETETGRGA